MGVHSCAVTSSRAFFFLLFSEEAVAFGQHHEIITYVSSSNPFEAVESLQRTAEFKATAFTSGEPGPRKLFTITVRFC